MAFLIRIRELAKSHGQALKVCSDLVNQYKIVPTTEVSIDFTNCNFIYPDYALLLLCTVKYLESLGYVVSGRIYVQQASLPANYLAGMKFFEELKVQLPFSVDKGNDETSVQIQKYTRQNQITVLHSFLGILRKKASMHENVYVSLDYCLNEILDNVLNHSEQNEGWIAAQYFSTLNTIRLIVCDYGIGVHKSLSKAFTFTEEEAILKCIEEGVTKGGGQGHGLYATAEFIKLNRGWMSIFSGNKTLSVSENETAVKDIDYWQGTCVHIRINTNVDVDYTSFTSKFYDYKKQVYEDLFGDRE